MIGYARFLRSIKRSDKISEKFSLLSVTLAPKPNLMDCVELEESRDDSGLWISYAFWPSEMAQKHFIYKNKFGQKSHMRFCCLVCFRDGWRGWFVGWGMSSLERGKSWLGEIQMSLAAEWQESWESHILIHFVLCKITL